MPEENGAVRSLVRPLGERQSRHRSLDERLSVRFQWIARLLARSFARLAPRSPVRRFLVVRRIRRGYAAANRRDFDVVLVGMDLGVYEYRPSRDLLPPDLDSVFRGRDGYLALWRYWSEAFADIRWDPEDVLDFGDKLLVTTKQSGRGSGSGIRVSESVYQLFTIRGGLIARQEDFLDRALALDAAIRED